MVSSLQMCYSPVNKSFEGKKILGLNIFFAIVEEEIVFAVNKIDLLQVVQVHSWCN